MSFLADSVSAYVSGCIGILVGNPLDLIKTRLQAGPGALTSFENAAPTQRSNVHLPWANQFEHWTALGRGTLAPILGYGALNALLFVTYNRSLALMTTGTMDDWPENPPAWSIWTAGAMGGLAIFVVSAPTELVKCRAQVSNPPRSSLDITKELWKQGKLRGLYMGGGITSIRDSVGYGFYFWSYHLSKQAFTRENESTNQQALKVLLCGGLAGVMTWASIFPLDVVKTRVQTWDLSPSHRAGGASQALLGNASAPRNVNIVSNRPSTFKIASDAYRAEGTGVFFRGLGICSARAFVVNAVQWAVYEWMMNLMTA